MSLFTKLIAYWPLNEASGSRADLHTGGHTLTDNNTVGSDTGLVYALAAEFLFANSEYLSRADHADLSIGNQDRTIAAWVRLDTKDGSHDMAGKGTATMFEWILGYDWGQNIFAFSVVAGSGGEGYTQAWDALEGGNPPALNTWYLVIGWHDAANDQIGIATSLNNFTPYTFAFSSAGVWDSTGDFEIGRHGGHIPFYIDGRIGPVMLFNDLLTGPEMTELYNGGAGLTYAAIAGPERRWILGTH